MTNTTLTPTQLAALRNAGPTGIVNPKHSNTGKALEERGLVAKRECGIGFQYYITPAGRAALAPAVAAPYKPEVARRLAMLAAKAK